MLETRLRLLTRGDRGDDIKPPPDEPVPSLAARTRPVYQSNLEEMHRVCASRGIPFLVAIQPWVGTRRKPSDKEREILRDWGKLGAAADPAFYTEFRADARSFLKAHGIPFIDLNESPAFLTRSTSLFVDAMHPNAEGHRAMAAEIHAKLLALLPSRTGPSR
jgi:lysophospholipase L1-like esterase